MQNLDDYAFVVIDEAHNLRNANTLRAEAVMQLLWGEYPKKVMLLTATPVNNSLKDLQTLVAYFVRNDAQFAASGIPSIAAYIGRAQKQDPETLSPEHLFDLMDKVAVRRTRRFIKKEYAGDMIMGNNGQLIPIEFPTPSVKRLSYDLDLDSGGIVGKVVHALKVSDDEELVIRQGAHRDPSRLSLARYAPSVYTLGNDIDALQITNVGLLRSGLLKRLESSTAALVATLTRLVASHDAFIAGLDAGYVMTGDALREYVNSEFDDLDEFLEGFDDPTGEQVQPAAEFDIPALRRDVELDLELLEELLELAEKRLEQGPDAKTEELLAHLDAIAAEAQRPSPRGLSSSDRRKVIIFTTFTDTAVELHRRLEAGIANAAKGSALADYRKRLAPPVFGARGGTSQEERAKTLAGFAPMTAGEVRDDGTPVSKDIYDIIVTTDVLAEGVNLQQAGRMVNYDLPWNPMRLVQRHGRIDRIGSPHKQVVIGCFFPAKNVDELLKLEETLQRKIAYANAAIGVGYVVPDQKSNPDVEVLFHDAVKDIKDLYDENATLLIEGGGTSALSGEEFRRRLARSMQDPYVKDEVLGLPYGSGSGYVSNRINQSGYVFCVKVGNHDQPWFRFVAADGDTWEPLMKQDGTPAINDDTLKCLMAADPGDREDSQVLSDAAMTKVFDAWIHARDDVHREWSKLTDWANLQPQIEKALRDAVQLVYEHGGFLAPEDQADLANRLNGKWENAIVRIVRGIVRDESTSEAEKVVALQTFVSEAGLPMPIPPQPLPPVKKDDIRVICWMAVSSHRS